MKTSKIKIETQDDKAWKLDGIAMGWNLPHPKPWILRLPIIRNFRAIFLAYSIAKHEKMIYRLGLGFPTGYDQWILYAIKKGWI